MAVVQRTVLKHPGSAYLIVAFVALCMTAVVRSPVQALVYLIPIGGAVYVARTATVVDPAGLHARAVLGSQSVPWERLRGLRLDRSGSVYAIDDDGSQLRLPCVRSTRLQPLIHAAAGRIPDPAAGRASDPPAGRIADLAAGRASDLAAGRASDLAAGRAPDPPETTDPRPDPDAR